MVTAAAQRVLYVDDEPTLVFLLTRALEKLGIASQGFASADEALAAFKQGPQAFTLVLTDFTMPGGMSGLELAQAMLAVRPDAAVVIASGAIDPAEVRRATAAGVRAVIQKPAKVTEMAELVRRLLHDVQA
ncbi:MAG TPA: response regulator [Steroidobacteraceae bacterium]|nr:response regulator [Steroidobacteraceae bacterium]